MHIIHEFSSPNYDKRPDDATIEFIILHYTDMPFNEALNKLCDPASKVSCHYIIKEDGKIFQIVDDNKRSWHAGKSCWQGREALNDCSVGIELDNLGFSLFTDLQMESCISLCKALVSKYDILTRNIIGHSDIAPSRKIDPGIYFDWARMADCGLGIRGEVGGGHIVDHYSIKSVQTKLAAIGYDIDITGKWDERTNAIIRAFQAHFCQDILRKKGIEFYRDLSGKYLWDEESNRVLNNLSKLT